MSGLIQKAIDETERERFGLCCEEAIHALEVAAERIRELEAQIASLTNNMPKSAIDLERENFELKAEVKEANEAALNHAIAAFTAERAQDAAEAKLEKVLGLLQIEADKPENDTVRSRFKAIIREAREL